jgi:hypothetical protein
MLHYADQSKDQLKISLNCCMVLGQLKRSKKSVLKIANKQADKMKEETGIETSSSEEEMKEYLLEVIKEVERVRKSL